MRFLSTKWKLLQICMEEKTVDFVLDFIDIFAQEAFRSMLVKSYLANGDSYR